MTTLPTPKFNIGDRVWLPGTNTVKKTHACPDCLGSRKWIVKTPAGSELEAPCQRCASPYRSSDIPSLDYHEHEPYASSLTIGSIRIDTAATGDGWGREPIEYMCKETGIGSGSIYRESGLFASEEAALASAQIEASEKNARLSAAAERLEKARISNIEFEAAHLKTHNHSIWHAWYAYRDTREEIEKILKDKEDGNISRDDALESIQEHLEWTKRDFSLPDIAKILRLLNTAAQTGDVTPLKNILTTYAELVMDVPASKEHEMV
jgi:hypothetical protein